MGFKPNITVTNGTNWGRKIKKKKKRGGRNKCKAVHIGRNNCINTVKGTSGQVRVLRENPLVRGGDTLNRSQSQAKEHKTSKLEQRNRTVSHITHGVILPLD